MNKIGIYTIGDLAKANIHEVSRIVGNKLAYSIVKHANGEDNRPVDPNSRGEAKSISNEITFSEDILDKERLENELLLLSDYLGFRIRKKLLKGRTIFIKIKYSDFKVITRSITLKRPTNFTDIIYQNACELLKAITLRPVRLLGLGLGNFEDGENLQMSLFDNIMKNEEKKQNEVDHVLDELRIKYGYDVLKRGSLLNNLNKPKKQ